MAQRYWFKTHKRGIVLYPSTWQGWLVIVLYFAVMIYTFVQIDGSSHSVSDTLINFVPRAFLFSAMLICISYLKGEPHTERK